MLSNVSAMLNNVRVMFRNVSEKFYQEIATRKFANVLKLQALAMLK
jgi:hypothetical protein